MAGASEAEMDIPVLKYVDILVGLAVVIFLGATVVASISQLLIWRLGLRARALRTAIEELLIEIDPSLEGTGEVRGITELLLRHPMLGQAQGPIGSSLTKLRNALRRGGAPKLLTYRPAEVVQRHELAIFLIEWAAGEGPLGVKYGSLGTRIEQALRKNGVADPGTVIRGIRFKILQKEKDQSDLASHLWAEHALIEEAPSDFLAKIHTSFDNAMRRAIDAFTVEAKFTSSVVALALAVSIQLDALSLIRRLSVDESLRESLLQEAQMLTARIDEPQSGESTSASSGDEGDRARAMRREIDGTLALLRRPRYAAIPDTLVWQKLARKTLCPDSSYPRSDPWTGTIQVGSERYPVMTTGPLSIESLEKAINESGAPAYLYRVARDGDHCLEVVARSPDVTQASLQLHAAGSMIPEVRIIDEGWGIDSEGIRRRMPGVLFSWLLLSLGAPYWYELLKNLLRLRSVIADKDDKERKARETSQEPMAPVTADARDALLQQPAGEAGELRTAAVG